jgi:phenol hydroxylase P0 protein
MSETKFDMTRKFVRISRERENGFIEFEYAIGEPDVAVELIMPRKIFEAFCLANAVEFLDPSVPAATALGVDADLRWSLQDATHQRFR